MNEKRIRELKQLRKYRILPKFKDTDSLALIKKSIEFFGEELYNNLKYKEEIKDEFKKTEDQAKDILGERK